MKEIDTRSNSKTISVLVKNDRCIKSKDVCEQKVSSNWFCEGEKTHFGDIKQLEIVQKFFFEKYWEKEEKILLTLPIARKRKKRNKIVKIEPIKIDGWNKTVNHINIQHVFHTFW